MGQITYTWNGSTSTTWSDPANWTPSAGASFPGTVSTDKVVIDNNSTPFAPIFTGTQTIGSLTVNNAFGTNAGATLTIASGTLNVSGATGGIVTLAGGNIINNGSLTVFTSSSSATAAFSCTLPVVLPASPTTYGYSGSGNLTVDVSAVTTTNTAAIGVQTALNANTTYQLLFNGITNFSLGTTNSFAIRNFGGSAGAAALIVGGTGFTHGTVDTPKRGGVLSSLGGGSLTVNSGTTINMVSLSSNACAAMIVLGNSTTAPTVFTNNGTINLSGTTTTRGIDTTTYTATATTVDRIITFNNYGTINVNVNATGLSTALSSGWAIGHGTAVNSNARVTLNNFGTFSLVNTSISAGVGQAIAVSTAGQRTNSTLNNKLGATFSMSGTAAPSLQTMIIVNDGTLNSDGTFSMSGSLTNSSTGIINYDNSKFNLTVATAATATSGSVYINGGNKYTVISTKETAVGTRLVVVSDTGRTFGTTPLTLTKVSGTGDDTIEITVVGSLRNMHSGGSTFTNNGTINSGRGSGGYLGIFASTPALVLGSTSVIAPGGTNGYGFISFTPTAAPALVGTIKLQIGGNTAAGDDYDQIITGVADSGFNVSGAALQLSGLAGLGSDASGVEIILANGTGTITGPFASVTGLTPGWSVDYSVTGKVRLVFAAVTPATNNWNGTVSTDWTNAGNWDAGAPAQNSDVVIGSGASNMPVISTNVIVNSISVSGGTLSVNAGSNLTVNGAVATSLGGTVTLASNANLIQTGTTNSNTGDITVNRNSNALSRLDYTMWSSPVTNASQFLTTFSPATSLNRFYNYNETTNAYNEIVTPAATPFAAATGYLIRMPNDHPTSPTVWTGSFSGVPNNGTINKAITYNGAAFGYNMVGNPYPSTIDAQAFIAANIANIESSLYFWRKINAATGSAYAVYNPMGSTTATPSSALPSGTIQVGQGFFVKAKSASSVNFTNAMRVANNGNQFFKTKAAQKDRVWLSLTNTSGVFSQALIGYTADATTGVDMYDAKYINDSPIALTSSINSDEYTIQGRPAFDANDVVVLSFKNDVAGDYTIALDHFDGVFATGQDVYLVDSKTGIETALKTTAYNFNAAAGTDNSRFSLKYQRTLDVNASAFNENSVNVYKNNGMLYVNSGSLAISNIKVFDIQGRLIAEQKNLNATSAMIKDLGASNQVLIVKIAGEDNSVVTKKVMN